MPWFFLLYCHELFQECKYIHSGLIILRETTKHTKESHERTFGMFQLPHSGPLLF
ncbi:hypothetical protein POUND7_010093 [Theobroma cacao]